MAKVFSIIIVAIVIFLFVCVIIGGIINESNAIASGVIVDKHMDEGGTYYSSSDKGGHLRSTPPSYTFTIQGEKDGEIVKYTFNVSESEYNRYKIGDYYNR